MAKPRHTTFSDKENGPKFFEKFRALLERSL